MVTNSNQSEKVKRWAFTGLIVLVILVLLGLLGYSNWRIFNKRREVKAELNQLKRKIDALEQEKATIKAKLNEEDDYMTEEIAREQLNLKKPGEKVIDIKKPPQKEEEKQEKKWWEKWLNKVKFW